MSVLTIYSEQYPQNGTRYTEFDDIHEHLKSIGVLFERWQTNCELTTDADQDTVLVKYCDPIAKLRTKYTFQSLDVVRVSADHPEKDDIRKKFLSEHIHEDFEIRFFIEGCGLFYLHVGERVYAVLCEQGDLISVPADTKHWFDMGENPNFTCIRFFTTAYGWVAKFTGDNIANQFPTLEQFVSKLS